MAFQQLKQNVIEGQNNLEEQFILKSFKELTNEEHSLFKKFKFRELHPDYLKSMNALGEDNFNFLIYNNSVLIPFLNFNDNNLKGKNFDFLYEVYPEYKETPIFFLDHLSEIEFINISKRLKNKVILCNENQKTLCKANKIKEVSYNTFFDLTSNKDFEAQYKNHSRKSRMEYERWYRNFEKNPNLDIRKIDLDNKVLLDKMKVLYRSFSMKFDNFIEKDDFWYEIKKKENVEFLGVFYFDNLVCFSGLWFFKKYSIFSMIGKDEDYEKLLRKSCTYFIFNLLAAKKSKAEKKEKIYYGYGNISLKKQLLMNIENLHLAKII